MLSFISININIYLLFYYLVINDKPLFIREYSKNLLFSSVWKDTSFLSQLNVMDYSLVVGVDNETHELITGIVGKYFFYFFY